MSKNTPTPVTLESISLKMDSSIATISSKMDSSITALSSKLDSSIASITNLSSRMINSEKSIATLSLKIDSLAETVNKLPTRDEMNHAIEHSFNELADMTNRNFIQQEKSFVARFDQLSTELHEFKDEVHERFDRLDICLTGLETIVVSNHGKRLRRIETKLQLA